MYLSVSHLLLVDLLKSLKSLKLLKILLTVLSFLLNFNVFESIPLKLREKLRNINKNFSNLSNFSDFSRSTKTRWDLLLQGHKIPYEVHVLQFLSYRRVIHRVRKKYVYPLVWLPYEMAIFKRAWQMVKVLSHPWPSSSTLA